jgi:GH25 family lysozyme M1 (1,4-beta-N-acetylmuramidase)
MVGRLGLGVGACLGALLISLPGATASAVERLPGVDVSRFQEQIEWSSVGAAGIRFAFVQASRGSGNDCSVVPSRCGPDSYYDTNYAEAKAAGIRVGAYHRAFVGGDGPVAVRADAKAEADVFIGEVGKLARGDLLPALDMETPFAELDAIELQLWARTWLRRVRRALGAKPIVYTNNSSWSALAQTTEFAAAGHKLWVANWHVRRPLVPAADWNGRSWRIWQYTSSGTVPGISGKVDRNWLRGGWRGLTVR